MQRDSINRPGRGQRASDPEPPDLPPTGEGRAAMGVAGVFIGLLAAWMMWIVNKFLDGNTWGDLIVRLILDELTLTAALFGLMLLVWALFAPAWLSRALQASRHKLQRTIALVVILFGAATLILLFVVPVLVWLGIVE
jgi:hypothetical protein